MTVSFFDSTECRDNSESFRDGGAVRKGKGGPVTVGEFPAFVAQLCSDNRAHDIPSILTANSCTFPRLVTTPIHAG